MIKCLIKNCTGIYNDMRVLEGEAPMDLTPSLMKEEEEELLYGSNYDRRTVRNGDTGMKEEEAEKAWKQAEKEAEEADPTRSRLSCRR